MRTFLFIGILYFIPCSLKAQSFVYTYDNNGNIVSRKLEEPQQENLQGNKSNEMIKDLDIDVNVKQDNDRLIIDVSGNHNKEVDVHLYDSSSKLVNQETSTKSRHILDCSTVPDGVYILEVKCADSVHSQKILKK